jgi:hypothetical protein
MHARRALLKPYLMERLESVWTEVSSGQTERGAVVKPYLSASMPPIKGSTVLGME